MFYEEANAFNTSYINILITQNINTVCLLYGATLSFLNSLNMWCGQGKTDLKKVQFQHNIISVERQQIHFLLKPISQ